MVSIGYGDEEDGMGERGEELQKVSMSKN